MRTRCLLFNVARHLRRQKALRAALPRGSLPLPFFCKIVYNNLTGR